MAPDNNLLKRYFNSDVYSISRLKGDGSDRCIYRAEFESISAIYIQSPDINENKDFLYLSEILKEKGIPVPEVYLAADDFSGYIIEDLGHHTLAEVLYGEKANDQSFILDAYQKVILLLIEMQGINNGCLKSFLQSRQMGLDIYKADLQYFKTEFLEQFQYHSLISSNALSDFNRLMDCLMIVDHHHFVYRDFQSRNFMWVNNQPVFIDYQSAMMGSLYYDLGSLLYSSRSGLSQRERDIIIKFYFQEKQLKIDFPDFVNQLYQFILLRRLRSLGSYGYLSRKGKTHFAEYIPQALKELTQLFDQGDLSNFRYIRIMLGAVYDDWLSNTTKCI